MLKRISSLFIFIMLVMFSGESIAQELQVRLSVNTVQVSTNVDKKVFVPLQNALNTFLNNRKWTTEIFQQNEKIVCNFQINIRESLADNSYRATLMVQAARPVYNSSYQAALINFQDEAFVFKYVEYQPIEFNENRVSGSDPLASTTSIGQMPFRRLANARVNCAGMCCTIMTGGASAGRRLRSASMACVPPVDAPITMRPLAFARASSLVAGSPG